MTESAADEAIVLDLYKTAVDLADRWTSRRAGANTFFLTLNTALAAMVGIVSAARRPPPHGSVPAFDGFGLAMTAAAGIVLAAVWWALLRYYRRLSKAKWDVINELEERLPVRPFTDEWAKLHPKETDSGTVGKRTWLERLQLRVEHREATVVEQVVPWVFIVIYLVLGVRAAVA
jgi:hypothetical protein